MPNLSLGTQISSRKVSKKLQQEGIKSQICRKLTTRCPDNVDAVRDSVGRSPKKCPRGRSQELGFSGALSQRILKKDLYPCPYRIQNRHELTPTDIEFLISVINHNHINGLPWCNGYRRRKWTRRHEFKSWTRLIAFHIALMPLGKV